MLTQRGKFNSLELGRMVAAILVVFYHIDKYYFVNPKYYRQELLGGLFKFGHSGVDFFFVLSGFIMIWVHHDDFGKPEKVIEFIRKRVIRIYPLVWFSTLMMFAIYLVIPGAGKAIYRTPLVIVESLGLVGHNPMNAIDFPSWTLWHENIFYLFCAAMIWRPRIGGALLAIWAALCVAVGISGVYMETSFYPLAPVNALFWCGAATAQVLIRYRMPAPGVTLGAGLLAFFGFGLLSNTFALDESLVHGAFGLAAVLIVAGAVELERSGRLKLPAWAAQAGMLSYPLYLTHMLVLPIVAKAMVASKMTHLLPAAAGLVVLASASLAGALFVHRLIEKPATLYLRARLLPRPRSRATLPPQLASKASA